LGLPGAGTGACGKGVVAAGRLLLRFHIQCSISAAQARPGRQLGAGEVWPVVVAAECQGVVRTQPVCAAYVCRRG
jgi:hypothetical protein